MAANQRKQFVQARLKALGAEGTPEQKAKLRERFNTLSQTKEGRTKIAQVVLPSGTASDRAALKKALRPPSKNKPTSTATSTTTSTTGVMGGVNTPTGSSASSAVVPGAKITPSTTVPRSTTTSTTVPLSTTTSTTVPRSTTTTTSTTVPVAQKSNNSGPRIVNFEPQGIPRPIVKGPKSKYSPANFEGLPFTKGYKLGSPNIPGFSNLKQGVSQITSGKKLSGVGNIVQGIAEVGIGILSFRKGKSSTTLFPKNPFASQKVQPFDPSKMRAALESYKGTPTKSSKISGANKPTSMPKVPDFKAVDPKTGRYLNLFE